MLAWSSGSRDLLRYHLSWLEDQCCVERRIALELKRTVI